MTYQNAQEPFADNPPWWTAPYTVALTVMPVLLLAALLVPPEFHWLVRRPGKFMNLETFVIGFAGLVSFAASAFLASRPSDKPPALPLVASRDDPVFCRTIVTLSWAIAGITILAYVVWLGGLALRPDLIKAVLTLQKTGNLIRNSFDTVSGVTTFVQSGILYSILLCVRWVYIPKARPSRTEWLIFGVILVFATFRNLMWGERIALLEPLIPLVLFACRKIRRPGMWALAPVLGVVALFFFFSGFEYFRSWRYYSQTYTGEFWTFMFQRLSAYYIVAIDNGAGYFLNHRPSWIPVATADWFWKFPVDFGLSDAARDLGINRLAYREFLYWHAWPELNNSSGLFAPFFDFGVAGGLLVWSITGLFVGYLYGMFRRGSLVGLILYPSWYFGVLELARIPWFFSVRMFAVTAPSVAVLLILTMIASRRSKLLAPA